MANTFTLISTTTLSTTGSTIVDVNSIPQTFTDLVIKATLRTTRNAYDADDISFRINGSGVSTGVRRLLGTGNSVTTVATDNAPFANSNNSTANTFSNLEIYIPNYTGSTAKSVSTDAVTENNATGALQTIQAAYTSSTSAVTSIGFSSTNSFNFMTGCTISIYGVLKGSGGATVA